MRLRKGYTYSRMNCMYCIGHLKNNIKACCIDIAPRRYFARHIFKASAVNELIYIFKRRDMQCFFFCLFVLFCFLSFCHFLGLLPWHMEVPRLGVESEL